MPQYFWYQQVGGEDTWNEALSEHRDKIVRDRQPAFTTILDAHGSPDASWDREEYAKLKYSGPLYFDFDAETAEQTIPDFHKFLASLAEMGVNLKSLRLYATGGRGFHIEIPEAVFMAKVPRTGVLVRRQQVPRPLSHLGATFYTLEWTHWSSSSVVSRSRLRGSLPSSTVSACRFNSWP